MSAKNAGDKDAPKGAALQLEQLRQHRDKVTVAARRRELRKWLRESKEGKGVERWVGRLLGGRWVELGFVFGLEVRYACSLSCTFPNTGRRGTCYS